MLFLVILLFVWVLVIVDDVGLGCRLHYVSASKRPMLLAATVVLIVVPGSGTPPWNLAVCRFALGIPLGERLTTLDGAGGHLGSQLSSGTRSGSRVLCIGSGS